MQTKAAKILIVDDEEANREMLADQMSLLGHECLLAENGVSALAQITKNIPDLVLLDIMMPEMDGHQVLERLKADGTLRHIPVIVISALDEMDSVVRCIANGAEDYLVKPIKNEVLNARVSNCLEKKRLRDQEQSLRLELEETNHRLEERIQKQAAQLAQAQRLEAIGTLAGGIAHDFNNVLGAIIGYTEMVTDDLPDGSPFREDLDRVLAAGNRAKDLVLQILTFCREVEHEESPVDLHLLIKEVLKLLRATLPATIEIREDIEPDCGTVMADPTQMHQVIMNLCTNAYHAMRENGGILEISLSSVQIDADSVETLPGLQEGMFVRLTVSDTGHGMDKETIDRIFDPYFTTKEPGEGTGLGLAVLHGIVTSHNGHTRVYSEPGRGTTFHIYLPCIASAEAEEFVAEEPLARGRERVLVVDDEELLAALLRRKLRKLGYDAVAVASGPEALEAFRAAPDAYDLVISDMTMPKMTGEQLAGEILGIRPNTPIILTTGFSGKLTSEKLAQSGIHAVLMKPVSTRDLAMTVREALDHNG